MTLQDACRSIHFRFLKPSTPLPEMIRALLIRVFQMPQCLLDRLNTVVPFLDNSRARALRRASRMQKMSTYAVGAIINEAVRQMPEGTCYLNIGTWKGFSLFAGMAGNPDRSCIGVDSFVEFGGPREIFLRRFQRLRTKCHEFFDADWRAYMKTHTRTIGVFFYDAAHDQQSQFDSLMIADPFIVPGGVIIVDDTNWPGPRDAVKAFLSQKKNYELVFDQTTAGNCHPTFWNGVMILRKCSSILQQSEKILP